MKTRKLSFTLAATLLLAAGTFTGCESTDSGSTQVSSNVYYGVGFYDPWYYGYYDGDYDVVVTPPWPGSPPDAVAPPGQGLRPSHPIALPPDASPRPPAASQRPADASSRPAARPMPSIPSAPRPMPRPAMRR